VYIVIATAKQQSDAEMAQFCADGRSPARLVRRQSLAERGSIFALA
jgi:hypothetical protein